MLPMRSTKLLLACSVCLAGGYFLGSLRTVPLAAEQPVPPKPPVFATAARLGADVYVQTAAEYRACCLQIYQCADLRLQTLLATLRPRPAKPALVMDLDETVLDNSAFESFLHRHKLDYSDPLWEMYERDYPDEVALVPGALAFIRSAEKQGVAVVYLSNRTEQYRASTVKALVRLGLTADDPGDRLLLKEKKGTSDKSARRERAAARYNVLLYFGDNLRDFSDTFAAPKVARTEGEMGHLTAIRRRLQQVDEAACHWGIDWFVLPNPIYGEWEKLLGDDPLARLRPTRIKPPRKQ